MMLRQSFLAASGLIVILTGCCGIPYDPYGYGPDGYLIPPATGCGMMRVCTPAPCPLTCPPPLYPRNSRPMFSGCLFGGWDWSCPRQSCVDSCCPTSSCTDDGCVSERSCPLAPRSILSLFERRTCAVPADVCDSYAYQQNSENCEDCHFPEESYDDIKELPEASEAVEPEPLEPIPADEPIQTMSAFPPLVPPSL